MGWFDGGRFNNWYDYLNPLSYFGTIYDNLDDGYDFGDLSAGLLGISTNGEAGGNSAESVSDKVTTAINDHGLDENGNIDINPADPTSSAANVINYDPSKSASENMLGYAVDNNSASAYANYLQNLYNTEMSNSAISRAIADAEKNGISKYQLFQSGNAAASSPSSGSSLANSYENAMNRRESWNEKELAAIVKIITTTVSSALNVMKK